MRGTKPAQVLRILRRHAEDHGVRILTGQVFSGFTDDARPMVEQGGTGACAGARAGALRPGWRILVAHRFQRDWLEAFEASGADTSVPVLQLRVELDLPGSLAVHAGRPLKEHRVAGRTSRGPWRKPDRPRTGSRGNAVYPWCRSCRQLLAGEEATLHLDLKPDHGLAGLEGRLRDAVGAERRNAAGLDRPSWALLKAFTGRRSWMTQGRWPMR